MKPETIEEGQDEEVVMKQIVAKDPFEPRLKPLSADKGNFCSFTFLIGSLCVVPAPSLRASGP